VFVQGFEFSVFEVNIRFVGGMLACYALTGDAVWTVFIVHCTNTMMYILLQKLSVCLSHSSAVEMAKRDTFFRAMLAQSAVMRR